MEKPLSTNSPDSVEKKFLKQFCKQSQLSDCPQFFMMGKPTARHTRGAVAFTEMDATPQDKKPSLSTVGIILIMNVFVRTMPKLTLLP